MGYIIPPYSRNEDGELRKIGFELEFGNIDIADAADALASIFPGSITQKSDFEYELSADELGIFTIELDWQLGKKIAEKRTGKSLPDEGDKPDTILDSLKWLATQVVPVEVVCPPIELHSLKKLDAMVQTLRNKGAKGTDASYLYAFGVHINPEIPDSSASSIIKYLQAFALAQEWLFDKNQVDPIRKITPYIQRYPKKYVNIVLQYDRETTIEQLIDEYVRHNDTRNRALDMLPLWKHLKPDYLEQFNLNGNLTQARPTFHYRLPNCEIEKKGWYLSKSWKTWCVVEQIASDDNIISTLMNKRCEDNEPSLLNDEKKWHNELEEIFADLQSE